jgi:hypothetical protein
MLPNLVSFRVLSSVLSLCVVLGCTRAGADTPQPSPAALQAADYVLLIPDWTNDVVHRISLDGTYEGEFIGASKVDPKALARGLWESPRALLLMPDHEPTFWMGGRSAITQWDGGGTYLQTIFADTTEMEVPVCLAGAGNGVVVVSQDKSTLLLLGADGKIIKEIHGAEFAHATDCRFGSDGLLYVSARQDLTGQGLVSAWDVRGDRDTEGTAKPEFYKIAPQPTPNATAWLGGLVFDDNGDMLVTEFAQGRVERWDTKANTKSEVLLDSGAPKTFKEIERGPDGLVYVAGNKGVYRFPVSAHASDLKDLEPFFDAGTITSRYKNEFSPSGIVIVPRTALGSGAAVAR